MSQIVVNSANIKYFGFSAMIDIANRRMIFDISKLTEFVGSGGANILGINFSLNDASNNPLIPGNSGDGIYDWDDPNILVPSTDANPDYAGESTFEVDLEAIFGANYTALFQNFRIQGAIKDEDGNVYETIGFIQPVVMPTGFTDYGYVPGKMLLKADCANGYLTVKETTDLSYCGKLPDVTESEGSLYYPRGTVDPVAYAFDNSAVAFTNSVVYTGNYKIVNTTIAQYYGSNGFITKIEYYSETEALDVTCEKQMLSVMCCLTDFQQTMLRHCSGAQYAAMLAKWNEAGTWLAFGLAKENGGKDASAEAQKIRSLLNCNCTDRQINRIAPNPVNPIIYSIVVDGKYGTTVTPVVNGNTKTFTAESDVYLLNKIDPADLSFTIVKDESVPGIVKYSIGFDYTKLAVNISSYINTASVKIGVAITLCSIDYNGEEQQTVYPEDTPISTLLQAMASVGCDTAAAISTLLSLDAINGVTLELIDGIPTVLWGGDLTKNTVVGGTLDYHIHIKNNTAIGEEANTVNDDSPALKVTRYGKKGRKAIDANMSLLTAASNEVDNYVTTAVRGILYTYLNDQKLVIADKTIVAAVVGCLALSLNNKIEGTGLTSFHGVAVLSDGDVVDDDGNDIEELNTVLVDTPAQSDLGNDYTGTIAETCGIRIKEQQGGIPTATQTDVFGIIQEGEDDQNYLAGQTGIGTKTPDASAKLQVDSTTQGAALPRMTTTQIDAIPTPLEGLEVYDTTLKAKKVYNGTEWVILEYVTDWVYTEALAASLFAPAGTIDYKRINYCVKSNSVILDFSIAITTSADGIPDIRVTLPVDGKAGKKYHSFTGIALGGGGSVGVAITIANNVTDTDTMSLSALDTVVAGSYYFNGQITYEKD